MATPKEKKQPCISMVACDAAPTIKADGICEKCTARLKRMAAPLKLKGAIDPEPRQAEYRRRAKARKRAQGPLP